MTDHTIIYTTLTLLSSFLCIYAWKQIFFRKRSHCRHTTAEGECGKLECILHERTEKYIHLEREAYISLGRKIQFGAIAQGLFHDLMNAFSGLSLHVERMTIQHLRHETQEIERHIASVRMVTERIRSFIHSVRTTIQMQVDASPSRCALSDPLSVMRDLYRYRMRMGGITFTVEGNEDLIIPLHIAEANHLFMNIISNAIDACDGVHRPFKYIAVRIEEIAEVDHTKIRISIIDNGTGMNTDSQRRACTTPFTTKSHGSGIGLMSINDLVRTKLHGSLSITSEYNKGTRVDIQFSIPLSPQ